jgi:phosphoglycerate dehydrogenase-like enzyme
MLNNSIPTIVTNQRDSHWKEAFGTPVGGKTLVVVGVGNIGGAAARHAKRLGMTVLGVRRGGRPRRGIDEMFRPDELGKVLPRADFVLVTLPLTRETRGLIGRAELAMMKPGAGFVNIGRGGTVDYVALAEMLESGRLSGAVLDAYEQEPLPSSSPLWGTRNLILSPHCSSSDLHRYIPLTLDVTFENLARLLEGRPLINRISRTLGY